MKTLFVLFAMMMSAHTVAEAAQCTWVCAKMSAGYNRQECYDVTARGFFQQTACEVCGQIGGDANTLSCVRAIEGKNYSRYELEACRRQYGSAAVYCMRTSGNGSNPYPNPPNPNPGHCDLARLERQIDGAIGNYYGGNYPAVLNTLNNMKAEIRGCR